MAPQRDIKAEIAGREREVLAALGISWPPHGAGKHIRCPFPDHEDKNPSWRWDGDAGKWFCSCGSGDILDAVQRMGRAPDFIGAADFARDACGLEAPTARRANGHAGTHTISEKVTKPDNDEPGRKAMLRIADILDGRKNKHGAALRLWREATPIEGTIAERYLLNIRGVALPPAGAEAIRFHPRCYHGPTGYHWPAMIALMTDPATGEPGGVHRTFLDPDDCMKAEIEPVKMMLGNAGVVRLCADEDVTQGLGISEGIETGLAVIRRGWTPVWAALTAGGIERFPVLPGIDVLSIFTDADDAGLKAARECAATWNADGREVRAIRPNTEGKDWAA